MANYTRRERFGKEFGAALRQSRQEKGISIERLSRKVGINAGNLSKLETGKTVPRLDTACRLASAIGVPVQTLVAWNEKQAEIVKTTGS